MTNGIASNRSMESKHEQISMENTRMKRQLLPANHLTTNLYSKYVKNFEHKKLISNQYKGQWIENTVIKKNTIPNKYMKKCSISLAIREM
jgi:hypothetical protein